MALINTLAYGEVPENPMPLLVELHPPFHGPYWSLGTTSDGHLLLGSEYNVGIFDGLRWHHIRAPGFSAIRAFVVKSQKIWLCGTSSIGWISEATSEQSDIHCEIAGLSGDILHLFDAGPYMIAISSDSVMSISDTGRPIEKLQLPRTSAWNLFRWSDGWIIVSSTDAFFIQAHAHLTVSSDTPLPREFLIRGGIMSAVTIDERILLTGSTASYWLENNDVRPIDVSSWSDDSAANPTKTFITPDRETLIRVGLHSGIDGFLPNTLKHLWHLGTWRHLDGNPNARPLITDRGIYFTTDSHVYWMPSPTKFRVLSRPQHAVHNVDRSKDGFWISTTEGSWHVSDSAWETSQSSYGETFLISETSFGTVRGTSNAITLGSKIEPLKGTRPKIDSADFMPDSIAIAQFGRLSIYDRMLNPIAEIEVPFEPTSIANLGHTEIISGTTESGVWRWANGNKPSRLSSHGACRSVVTRSPDGLVVLWDDGLMEIGSSSITLPKINDGAWRAVADGGGFIVAAGQAPEGAILMLVNKDSDEKWRIHVLEHPALSTVQSVDRIAICNGRIALAGPGGCIDVALSAFDRNQQPIDPEIAFQRVSKFGHGSATEYDIKRDGSQLYLDGREDDVRFFLKGGPEYWTQRVRFRYRITPGPADWTDLDPAQEITLQRIGTGSHTLEIEGRSILWSRTARFSIVRPPDWYFTGWAYATYAAMVAGAAFGVVLWRTRRLSERAQLLEERVAQRTAELQKANEAKSEFLAGMSHEIRNPLNGVIGLSGMLRDSAQSDRDRRLTESLRACADQLRLVLDDILDFSLIERGEVQLQSAPFDAATAIRAAALAVDPKLERTRLNFAPEIEGRSFNGDEGKIRQIVSNLISNAHRYGVPPEAKVTLTRCADRLVVTVSNTGPDIPLEDQKRIFGSFERGRSIAHKYVRGAGLGLTISVKFAQAMGGDVTVKSENGLTCFTFSAPLPEGTVAATVSTPVPPRRAGTVLAIEDETYNRLVLGHVLNQLGYEVDWAESGMAALEMFTSRRDYDFIFTDWMLPDIEGAELVHRLKEIGGHRTPPIVAVTAYATAEKRLEAFAAGVAAFVTKPITREKIESAVPRTGDPTTTSEPSGTTAEPLRLGVLLESVDPIARLTDYRTQLLDRLTVIERALRDRDADRAARTAHQLASQLLAIHHETFANELRALESAATRGEWNAAESLYASARTMSESVITVLEKVAAEKRTKHD